MATNQSKNLVGMGPVARVHDDVEADAAKGGVGPEAVDADMKDVDVLGGENPSQLVEKTGLVVEPGAEGEIATR